MRLKSVELVGFKSFLEPTLIGFAPGVTAVVGPNGCGKSNVVDALRWVLGEQSPSRLRGRTVEDLIFTGNESHPAAGMAEVSLTLEADDLGPLPEPYAGLSEICVTRRAYRLGDCEYLINRVPCRLKDIAEFFMAAQIHSRGYALIEQGRIEEIIQSKPAEIRTLVEEAAGLALFKGRREMSERKLERVRENLARVDDILAEIERQLNYARRQAKKAEAYRLLRAELFGLERRSAARRLIAHRLEFEREGARAEELRAETATLSTENEALQGRVEALVSSLGAERARLEAASRELDKLRTGSLERARTRDFISRRLSALDELQPEVRARLKELEERAVAHRAARAASAAALAREINEDDGSEAALHELADRHAAARARVKALEERGEELKDEIAELVREGAAVKGRLGALSGEREEVAKHLEGVDDDLGAARAELEPARSEAESSAAALQAGIAELERLEEGHGRAAQAESAGRAMLEKVSAELLSAREALASARARDRRPFSEDAAKRLGAVLESLNGDRPKLRPAFLAEVIKAPAGLEPALEAVLAGQGEAVIVESQSFALKAIEVLKETRGGRLSFIAEPAAERPHPPIEAPGIEGRLLDKLLVDPGHAHVVEALFGQVLLAADFDSAVAAAAPNGNRTVFVTREGDLVWPGRMISGGSIEQEAGAAQSSGPLSTEAAEAAVKDAEAKAEAAARVLELNRAARLSAQSELDAARRRLAAAERSAADRRGRLASAEQRRSLIETGALKARRRRDEIQELCAAAGLRLDELLSAEGEARKRLGALKAELGAESAHEQEIGQARTKAAAGLETRRSKLAALNRELGHLADLCSELDAQIEQHRSTLERADEERAELSGKLEQLVGEDREASAREAELCVEVEPLGARCEVVAGELEAGRAALKEAGERLSALRRETVESEVRHERASALSEELARSFAERFKQDFEAVRPALTAELAAADAAREEERLLELRAKAERMGEVNLAAEGEVRELEERERALNAERGDLKAAVADLTHTIQKLNREARRRFSETFEGAARNFAELLPKLMRGAKGRLELSGAGEEEGAEAGVNVMIQPAGKKVRELVALSGGEKALAAMALVFSLFLLNPSPFCVMDEVDAPLDETSLSAFTALLDALKRHSQFIVITHNQRTMQKADHIHGVTMERPGISRVISLRIPRAA